MAHERLVRFLLCVDPDSHQVYTLNLETNDIHIEFDVPHQYRMQAEKDIEEIAKIIQLPSSKWRVVNEQSWRYRRRQFSDYLLHKMIDHEPTYLAQSPMSDAFSSVSTLKLFVNISEYLSVNTTEKYYENVNPLTLEIHVELVTCADELIKKILREVYNIFQVRLKPKSKDNQFILQVAGFREYLSGNYPILSYDRVRSSLRGIQFLQLTLKEVPKVKRVHQLFPPIFERKYAEISSGLFSAVPWDEYVDVPILLYYPAYPLPKVKMEMKPQQAIQFSRTSMIKNAQDPRPSMT